MNPIDCGTLLQIMFTRRFHIGSGYQKINPNEIENVLNKMFAPEWLRGTAAKVGYVQRNRKIDPVIFFWVVVLGFGVGMQRTLASLRRAYKTASAETLVTSSFYDRFNNELVAFLKECLAHGIAELSSHTSLTLSDKLKGFKDLIVADGTIIRLHDKLAEKFPGARGKAELKIHTATGITGNTKSIANQLKNWKKEVLENLPQLFDKRNQVERIVNETVRLPSGYISVMLR
ncbi:hypothetical protein [Desulfoscipio geothermicus]|uniref:Transposase n=1 Tax=Desulfoscipio geothermicus DSM 3669 TaxID=1121426 RepID=A0A1I6DWT9_9FIRM|nr:hypothetical protein [Desulfoscipio geothermicus]SFR09748.1 hypothetical protein SAMN05660706_11949 [Desulfoscipio geothermicus DSM 3669]